MAQRFYYYFDYGSGYVEVDPHDNNLKLAWVRGELNEFIARRKLSGTMTLVDTEAVAAESFFVGSGNLEVPMRIYEHGAIGVGTLIYEGWGTTEGVYDYDDSGNAVSVGMKEFRTNDEYTDLIENYKRQYKVERLVEYTHVPGFTFTPEDYVLFQADNDSIEDIKTYTFNGTTWTNTLSSFDTGTIGRIAGVLLTASTICYIDNYTGTLRTKFFSGGVWSSGAADFTPSVNPEGNYAICEVSATDLILIEDKSRSLRALNLSGGVWSIVTETLNFYEDLQYPSLCRLTTGTIYAFTDNISKSVQAYQGGIKQGEPFEISGVYKPKIASLDITNNRIAMLDEATGKLRALQYNSGTGIWSELAFIQLYFDVEPNLSYAGFADDVNVIDPYYGTIERYRFDPIGVTWSKIGSSLTIGNIGDAYNAAIFGYSISSLNYMTVIRSNGMVSIGNFIQSYVNYLNSSIGIDSAAFQYAMPLTGNGSTLDLAKICLPTLSTLKDNTSDVKSYEDDNTKLSAFNFLELAKLFQQYFYLEYSGVTFDYLIKFTQPDLFSSFGTDITVPTYVKELLNSREYKDEFKINFERIELKNEKTADFIGEPIEYGRKTDIELIAPYNVTTDARFHRDHLLGQVENFQKSGLFMYLQDDPAFNAVAIVNAGLDSTSTEYIENQRFSKHEIIENYYKDYRYANKGDVIINGVTYDAATFDTCRDIIGFPSINMVLSSFPSSIASLDWGGGVKSYITNLELELETYIAKIDSILLDL